MQNFALNIEDLTSQNSFSMYALKDVKLKNERIGYSFPIERHQLPLNHMETGLSLVPMTKYSEGKINFKDDCIFVKIDKFSEDRIYFQVKFSSKQKAAEKLSLLENDLKQKLYIRFVPNRITFRSCLQALDNIRAFGLSDFFENFERPPANLAIKPKIKPEEKFEKFEWFNKQVGQNHEQATAIKNIVNCTAYPFPYIIFGPPGTGKTCCIVECIAQILKLKPNVRVIVLAQSNSACDEIGVRLLKHVSWNKVFRYYSPSMQINSQDYEMPEILRRTSNLRGKSSQFPSKEEFSFFKVVITTLMSCSRLVQFDDKSEISRHFDYIFVDECASALEPESLVPIVGKFNSSELA